VSRCERESPEDKPLASLQEMYRTTRAAPLSYRITPR
jgi:hypothetical protein